MNLKKIVSNTVASIEEGLKKNGKEINKLHLELDLYIEPTNNDIVILEEKLIKKNKNETNKIKIKLDYIPRNQTQAEVLDSLEYPNNVKKNK